VMKILCCQMHDIIIISFFFKLPASEDKLQGVKRFGLIKKFIVLSVIFYE
jgi:hypothetical protein